MNEACKRDWDWADRWTPLLRYLIGPHLLVPATLEQDRHQATDLIVLAARDMRIACRVRRPGYARRFPDQFTIRSQRDYTNVPVELEKILEGWGDWMFYGHANGGRIDPWWLIDLSIFREEFEWDDRVRYVRDTSNGDGTHFRAYSINLFPPEFIRADSVRDRRRP